MGEESIRTKMICFSPKLVTQNFLFVMLLSLFRYKLESTISLGRSVHLFPLQCWGTQLGKRLENGGVCCCKGEDVDARKRKMLERLEKNGPVSEY